LYLISSGVAGPRLSGNCRMHIRLSEPIICVRVKEQLFCRLSPFDCLIDRRAALERAPCHKSKMKKNDLISEARSIFRYF
jgi:hypothetical protein